MSKRHDRAGDALIALAKAEAEARHKRAEERSPPQQYTVAMLIERLKDLPPDAPVWFEDPEGVYCEIFGVEQEGGLVVARM